MTKLTGIGLIRQSSFVITQFFVNTGSFETAGYCASITAVNAQINEAKKFGTLVTNANSGSPL